MSDGTQGIDWHDVAWRFETQAKQLAADLERVTLERDALREAQLAADRDRRLAVQARDELAAECVRLRQAQVCGDLVFGPEFRGERFAVAADGALYCVARLRVGWRWFGPVGFTNTAPTEAEAIAACVAHDRERRGVQPAREENR